MIPKIIFKYSDVYDKQWSLALNKEFDSLVCKDNVNDCLANFKNYWTEDKETAALNLISKYSGLKWQHDKIICFLVNNLNVAGFSLPLTVRIDKDYIKMCNTVIHELVHNILNQNPEEFKLALNHLENKFPSEKKTTIVHIIVNAVSKKVFIKVYGENEFKRIEKITKDYRGLKRANEILDEIYPELNKNIVKTLSD